MTQPPIVPGPDPQQPEPRYVYVPVPDQRQAVSKGIGDALTNVTLWVVVLFLGLPTALCVICLLAVAATHRR